MKLNALCVLLDIFVAIMGSQSQIRSVLLGTSALEVFTQQNLWMEKLEISVLKDTTVMHCQVLEHHAHLVHTATAVVFAHYFSVFPVLQECIVQFQVLLLQLDHAQLAIIVLKDLLNPAQLFKTMDHFVQEDITAQRSQPHQYHVQ